MTALSRIWKLAAASFAAAVAVLLAAMPLHAAEADAAVAALLATLIDEGARQGVRAETVRQALDGFERDPEVVAAANAQPEHDRTVGDYINLLVSPIRVEAGRVRLAEHAALLGRIKARFGVEPAILIAIWGIESRFGEAAGTRPVLRSLATLALEDTRRPAFWRAELLQALRIVQSGDNDGKAMLGSWAGAMGHTQFMPSTYNKHAVDFSGDGRRDIWGSIDDALASTANYLAHSGWQQDEPWGFEVTLPAGFDYALSEPGHTKPSSFWRERGVVPARGVGWPAVRGELRLLLPAGARGPSFLVTRNFAAVLRYNPAVSYALAVGLLADRIAGGGELATAWPAERALSRTEREELQQKLGALGLDTGGVDGLIGNLTRTAIRSYQRSIGAPQDGHPSYELLQRLRQPGEAGAGANR